MLLANIGRLRWATRFLMHRPLEVGAKAELLEKATAGADLRWRDGDPIAAANNAHYTNRKDELSKALDEKHNFLEGDVWLEGIARSLPLLDRMRQPIMAHYPDDVTGLTLEEWLEVGKLSGKGLKLDIKQSAAIPKIVETVERSGVPQERLIFNADMAFGPGLKRDWKFRAVDALTDMMTQPEEMREVREAFPKATIGVGLYTGKEPAASYSQPQLEAAIAIAQSLGGPITFPLRADYVNSATVAMLKPYGSVSIWNDPKTYLPDDLKASEQYFRDIGVDGMIDLREMARPVRQSRQLPPEPPAPARP